MREGARRPALDESRCGRQDDALQKTVRIDVHREAQIGRRLNQTLTGTGVKEATLESTLQQVGGGFDGRVMSGREAAVAAALEDRIAAIDGQLAEQEAQEQLNLWRQRADLMQQLVQVRVTRANYVGL